MQDDANTINRQQNKAIGESMLVRYNGSLGREAGLMSTIAVALQSRPPSQIAARRGGDRGHLVCVRNGRTTTLL